jgi:hypothetical protein
MTSRDEALRLACGIVKNADAYTSPMGAQDVTLARALIESEEELRYYRDLVFKATHDVVNAALRREEVHDA